MTKKLFIITYNIKYKIYDSIILKKKNTTMLKIYFLGRSIFLKLDFDFTYFHGQRSIQYNELSEA